MNEVRSASDIISNIFLSIESRQADQANNVLSAWNKILLSIGNKRGSNASLGQNLIDHSRIIDLKNGILLVETDHPGWIQMFRMHNRYILKELNRFFPSLNIRVISYKIKEADDKKTRSTLSDRERFENAVNMRYKAAEEYEKSVKKTGQKETHVPPEIKKIFENFGK